MPHCISKCSGIRVFGRRIKSLVFSTDVAIIKNINADAIIATGGPTEETILATIAAGANAITYTPPTNGQLFAKDMHRYREWFAHMDDPEEDEKASPSDTAQ